MSTKLNLDDDLLKLLRENLILLRVVLFPKAKEYVIIILDNDQKLIAYHYSDGNSTVREISKISGIGKDVITKLWNTWFDLGLGSRVPTQGGGERFVRNLSLESLGMNIPDMVG